MNETKERNMFLTTIAHFCTFSKVIRCLNIRIYCFILFGLALIAMKPCVVAFDCFKIKSVTPVYYCENDFKRISEHFSCKENTRYTIFRTDPAVREGLYFIVKLNHSLTDFPPITAIVLEYILPNSYLKQEKQFVLTPSSYVLKNSAFMLIGLTGSNNDGYTPYDVAAYCITLCAQNGQKITFKSYLWQTD